MLIADTTPVLIQYFFLGVPLVSLLLGLIAPRWSLAVPVGATLVLVVAAATGGDPNDMPGAGVFFTIVFGIAFIAPWFVGRGVRLVFHSASRRRRTRPESGH